MVANVESLVVVTSKGHPRRDWRTTFSAIALDLRTCPPLSHRRTAMWTTISTRNCTLTFGFWDDVWNVFPSFASETSEFTAENTGFLGRLFEGLLLGCFDSFIGAVQKKLLQQWTVSFYCKPFVHFLERNDGPEKTLRSLGSLFCRNWHILLPLCSRLVQNEFN